MEGGKTNLKQCLSSDFICIEATAVNLYEYIYIREEAEPSDSYK